MIMNNEIIMNAKYKCRWLRDKQRSYEHNIKMRRKIVFCSKRGYFRANLTKSIKIFLVFLWLSDLKRVVKRTEKDKETAYALLGQMKKQLTDPRRHYLEDVGARQRELVEKKCEILDTKYTVEEKTNKMDKLYLQEQERETKLNSELKLLSERIYKII